MRDGCYSDILSASFVKLDAAALENAENDMLLQHESRGERFVCAKPQTRISVVASTRRKCIFN